MKFESSHSDLTILLLDWVFCKLKFATITLNPLPFFGYAENFIWVLLDFFHIKKNYVWRLKETVKYLKKNSNGLNWKKKSNWSENTIFCRDLNSRILKIIRNYNYLISDDFSSLESTLSQFSFSPFSIISKIFYKKKI